MLNLHKHDRVCDEEHLPPIVCVGMEKKKRKYNDTNVKERIKAYERRGRVMQRKSMRIVECT
jgi:hypothetical protein